MADPAQEASDEAASWRCFIAVAVSDEVRAAAARLQGRLRRTHCDVSFPDPAKLHLTLVFLGDTLTGRIGEVKRAVAAAADGVPPFDLAFGGLGFFGPPRHPRVIWAGVGDPAGVLARLHEKLLANITELGFTIEKRPFRPHLTLGRIRSGRGLAGLTSMVETLKDTPLGGSRVEGVLLMRSRRDQPGASYEMLDESKLTGA